MLTIVACERDAGATAWAAIHDCVGTHAGNVDLLASARRSTFAEMYLTHWLTK